LLLELGYNYQLQKNESKAKKTYELVVEEVRKQPNYGYTIGRAFELKSMLDWALKTYEIAQKENPSLNFDYQIALLQGQMGNLELMTDKLLDYAFEKQESTSAVQNYLAIFIAEEANETFTLYLKKALLIRTQKTQDVFWNHFLSWFYVQQKEYGKAFIQERAVFKRDPDTFFQIVTLAQLAIEDKQTEDAKAILEFILANTSDSALQIKAHHYLLAMRIQNAEITDYAAIQTDLSNLLKQYGITPYSLELQLLIANFYAFNLAQPKEAIAILNKALTLPLNPRAVAEVKMKLADVLVYDEKFNQAILYYAQVEDNMQNNEIAYEAIMKMAKTNYYKNDFDWALQQVKTIKQSASLLVANDAIELYLLISDNSVEDSTRVALTAFSKADFKLYQNKNDEALNMFQTILKENKGDAIEDETLLKIAQIYTRKKQYIQAIAAYNTILEEHKESVFTDEALYFSAEIFRNNLSLPEKAKPLYEQMIFKHQDSIYFTDSRRQYRILRGDTNL
jgi:tetratricopeptide (TPR) repeat protein